MSEGSATTPAPPPSPQAARPAAVSPWERWGWAFAGVWLVFLVYPVVTTLERAPSPAVAALGLAVLAAFGGVYCAGFGWWRCHPGRVLAGLVVLGALAVPFVGWEAIALAPYLGVHSALNLPAPWWPRATVAVALLPLAALAPGSDFPVWFGLTLWPILVGMSLLRRFEDGQRRADADRASLALVAERERVARDVHDVLGHSLTALSIKAELAARLVDVDPARARAELESIQDTARQALAEVRATVGGLRAGNLEAELAAAPQVLADAGVETRVVGTVADTDPRHRTLLAWVLRESVTNVVRHAGARAVEVRLGPTGLSVTDDGCGVGGAGGRAGTGAEGNGLRGMRERVEDAGGSLVVRDAAPGTLVEVVLR